MTALPSSIAPRPSRNRRALCVLIAALSQATCAQPVPRDLNSDDVAWLEAASRKIHGESMAFDAAHHFRGKSAADAVSEMQTERYVCRLRFADLGVLSQAPIDPYVSCTQPIVPADDVCKTRSLTLQVKWNPVTLDQDQLVAQLKTLPVEHQYFYCEPRELGPPKR